MLKKTWTIHFCKYVQCHNFLQFLSLSVAFPKDLKPLYTNSDSRKCISGLHLSPQLYSFIHLYFKTRCHFKLS